MTKHQGIKLKILLLLSLLLLFIGINSVYAAGGDFANTDFTAAAPFTYNHDTGGGAYNDGTIGDSNDITEQLGGSPFSCGDVVTFLSQVEVSDSPVDSNQTIELDFRFLGNSTGQAGAAIIDVLGVSINYGSVENGDNETGINPGAGSYGIDSGIIDDGGSIATIVSETFVGTPFTPGAELLLTVRITDLEAGEKVVLRIDTSLGCDPGANPTGNLQGQLDAGRVIVADGRTLNTSDVINTGQQTIPFLKVGDIAGAGEALLEIEKTVTTSTGTCGVDDVETLMVTQGDTVKYCYSVTNLGTIAAYDIEVADDNGAPGDPSDDFMVTLNGLNDLDAQADLGDLSGGETIVGESSVLLGAFGSIINTATLTGNNDLSGDNYQVLSDSDIATVSVEQAPNNPPEAVNDSVVTPEDTPVDIDAASNDSDIDGNLDPSTATIVNGPSNGSLTNNGDGTFIYIPGLNYNGPDSFAYQICDADGLCDTAKVIIEVLPVNDSPVANDDAITLDQDTDAIIDVSLNDTDLDGNLDPSTVSVITPPSKGTVLNNGDGTFTYTPDANFNGTDSFSYEICDTDGLCDSAAVTINVLEVVPVNSTPVVNDDSESTPEDTPVSINAIANDTDPDGNLNPSSTSIVIDPLHGTLDNNGDGTFEYTPNANYNGTDSFIYEVCDTEPLCNTATVIIVIDPVNDAPVANDDSATTPEDTSIDIDVSVNDTDLDDNLDPSGAILVSGALNGTLTNNNDGSFTYIPNPDFNGDDSFTYEICDLGGLCDSATVEITVSPVNDTPEAVNDSAATLEDTPVDIDAAANDMDVDGNLDPSTVSVITQPSNGTVVNNGDGTFTYTPDANFNGTDSFSYEICDTDGLCDTATVNIDVTAVNDPPVASNDVYSTLEDVPLLVPSPGVLGNDTDVDGDPLTVNVLTEPSNGTLNQNSDGSFTYTPDVNFYGADSYTYEACDAGGVCDEATVTINVGAQNDPPVAVDDSYSTDEDTAISVNAPGILGNDTDVDGDPLTVSLLTQPENGTLSQNDDGSFTYTPDENYNGPDSYIYQACDSLGECGSATVYITVNPVNDMPVALNDSYTTTQDTTLTVNTSGLLENDDDIDGDVIYVDTYDEISQFGGSVVVNSDGSLSYTPAPGFAGEDTFTYTISDDNGGYDTATVTITVEAKNNRSISVDWDDWSLNGDILSGSFIIANQSGNYDVQIADLAVEVQYRVPGGSWTYMEINDETCSFNPEPLFLVVDQQNVTFSGCETATAIPADATIRITAKVKIFGRIKGEGKADGWFLSRLSK